MGDTERTEKADARRTQALAKVGITNRGVMLQAMDDLKAFAETAVNSGTAPKGMNVGQAMMAIQAGLERGLGPLGGLQSCVVINGQLSWRGWAAKALILQSGLVVPGTFRNYHEGTLDGPKADAVGYATAQRKGYDKPFVRTFSVADAKKAGLWNKGGPWQTRPGNMLEWRALGDLARFEFPEVLGGVPIADDVEGGYGAPAVTVESPNERAKRPAPKITDPLLAEVVEGDKTGIEAADTDEDRQKNLDDAAEEERREESNGDAEPGEGGGGGDAGEGGGAGPAEVSGEAREQPASDAGAGGEPAPSSDPGVRGGSQVGPKPGSAKDPCPRCGEEDTGFAMFGECGVCNYPNPEPGGEE